MKTLTCPFCGAENEPYNKQCEQCKSSLDFRSIDFQGLKNELTRIEQEFQRRYNEVSMRIFEAERQIRFNATKNELLTQLPTPETPITNIEDTPPLKVVNQEEEIEKALNAVKEREKQRAQEHEYHKKEQQKHQKQQAENKKQEQEAYARQQRLEEAYALKQEIKRQKSQKNAETVNLIVGLLFGPFAQFKDYATEVYDHYKAQNRLPALFLTVGGMTALLLGFGFLLQYSSARFFEIAKTIISFVAAFGFIFLGMRLSKKREKYADFAAAVVGLGVSINYLAIYFLSYSTTLTLFNSPYASGLLILFNTALASWLALRYETRIVLIVSLAGGALAPFYLQTNLITIFYFAYLWLLCVSVTFIGLKIKLKVAGTLSFMVSAAVTETIIYQYGSPLSLFAYTLAISAFAYFFYWFSLFDGKKPKEKLTSEDIFNLAANSGVLVLSLYGVFVSLYAVPRLFGYVLFGNAAVFLIIFAAFRAALSPKMQWLLFIFAGAFVAIAIPQVLERNISGVFWAIEGLALVFCGFLFVLPNVRREAYFLLGFGIARSLYTLPEIVLFWQQQLWTDGFLNLLSLGIILILTKVLLDRYKADNLKFERFFSYLSFELLSFWGAACLWTFLFFREPLLSYNLAFIGLFFFIWHGVKQTLPFTQWLGAAHLALLVFGILTSINQVNSTLFRDQTLLGKTAMIEIFVSFWLLRFFYEKIKTNDTPDVGVYSITKLLREIFYLLLPIMFLGTIQRLYPQYLPLALWLSVLIAFVVHEIVRTVAVLFELHLLVGIATWLILAFAFAPNVFFPDATLIDEKVGFGAVAFGLFNLFAFLFYKRGLVLENAQKSPYRLLFVYAFYFLGFTIFLLENRLLTNQTDFPTVLFTALYFLIAANFRKKIAPLQSNYVFMYRLSMFMVSFSLFIYAIYAVDVINALYWLMILPILVVFGLILYLKTLHETKPMRVLDSWWLHIAIAVFYGITISIWLPEWRAIGFSMILFIHAIALLFNSFVDDFKFLLKISIVFFAVALLKIFFFDMADASVPQKIIVFMVVGVLMLGGSYLFMRFKK